ncbi:MAG: diguanylate cyclase [Betaproteobacteria bacterium]|nr:diguanylate cyclase [Betaproteobacteria bacterium]
MTTPHPSLEQRVNVLLSRWNDYVASGRFEQFVEFTVTLNSLAEQFSNLRLSGLVRMCEGLENSALLLFGNTNTHPIPEADRKDLQRQVEALAGTFSNVRSPVNERRTEDETLAFSTPDWVKQRMVWLIADKEQKQTAERLERQLRFFGFRTYRQDWESVPAADEQPLAVLFFSTRPSDDKDRLEFIAGMRHLCPSSQLFFIGVPAEIEPIVQLIRSGIDMTTPSGEHPTMVLGRMLDLVQTREQEKYRVLIVEDSRLATTLIERTLTEYHVDSMAISDPGLLLETITSYCPDLILMDMYMPRFNGVEATRVLRQMDRFQSLPIIYLSSESDISLQVEALRLGGDQFITKPFNPIVLAATVRATIDRYRKTQRWTQMDGLTGLLNHTASKSRLAALVEAHPPEEGGKLCVVMIDIDHFKSVNDTYGHPVGDQVIRGLAWLLKGRLRTTDMIGRYGGEEFICAMPNADLDQAIRVIDNIRADFAAMPHAFQGGMLHASFSAGISSYNVAHTVAGLTEGADNALLEAKRNGRNQVRSAIRPGVAAPVSI